MYLQKPEANTYAILSTKNPYICGHYLLTSIAWGALGAVDVSIYLYGFKSIE